jgi:hypothetical protein
VLRFQDERVVVRVAREFRRAAHGVRRVVKRVKKREQHRGESLGFGWCFCFRVILVSV